MVRSELISKLSKKIQPKLKKSDIEKIVSILLEAIVDGIKKNKSTEFRNFGRFSVKRLKKKISRNPRTGEKIHKAENGHAIIECVDSPENVNEFINTVKDIAIKIIRSGAVGIGS